MGYWALATLAHATGQRPGQITRRSPPSAEIAIVSIAARSEAGVDAGGTIRAGRNNRGIRLDPAVGTFAHN